MDLRIDPKELVLIETVYQRKRLDGYVHSHSQSLTTLKEKLTLIFLKHKQQTVTEEKYGYLS